MLESVKNIANIIFFSVISVVTILSYLQARKTLFAPIRTETFKLQLKNFEEILSYFQNKSESDFLEIFDLDQIVSLNTLQMADSYIINFFHDKIKIDKEGRKKIFEPLVGGVVSKEHAEKYFQSIDVKNPIKNNTDEDIHIDSPAIVLDKWQKYEHGMIGFTSQYQEQMRELTRLAASPLLPKPLRDLIGEFEKLGHENLTVIGTVITDCAKCMTDHFPKPSDMKEFSPSWVWNEFNSKRKPFEPTAKKILDYMNDYLKIEQIMK